MKGFVQYAKGKDYADKIRVGIAINEYAGKTSFIATTYSTSKTFKTEKGANKWLNKMGYERIEISHATQLKIEERISTLRSVR